MSKVVVVTGASSGIGAALARQLAARGDRVVLGARREAALRQLADTLGDHALAVPADVTRRDDVEKLRDQAIARFHQVDVWVNNAGRGISKPTLELTDQEFDEMMDVNVKSALYGMQAIVPHFRARGGGHIINISSFLGRVPLATIRSAYSAAKAALNTLTANARMDLAASDPGIHVSLVIPGIVTTEFGRNAMHGTPPLRPGAGGAPPQNADEVAAAIVAVIDRPIAEVYTNPAHPAVAKRYVDDVGAFEASLRS